MSTVDVECGFPVESVKLEKGSSMDTRHRNGGIRHLANNMVKNASFAADIIDLFR